MDNRADTDRIRDDIRTLGSAVAWPCALARNSLGASQDRRGVCRGTVAAGANGPRGAALLPTVAARRRSTRLLLVQNGLPLRSDRHNLHNR